MDTITLKSLCYVDSSGTGAELSGPAEEAGATGRNNASTNQTEQRQR